MLIQQSKDYYVDVYSRSSSVTGSCTLLSAHFPNGKNFRFLVDCGMFQGGDETGKLNQVIPFNTEKISFCYSQSHWPCRLITVAGKRRIPKCYICAVCY